MATFAYSGRTRGGETVAGERIGDSMEAVAAALRREQIQVTRLAPVAARRERPRSAVQGVPAKNLAVFTRQFSVMIDAGLPLVQCLDILGNQEEHKYFRQVILQTRTDVEGGQALAEAMKRHPQVLRRAVHEHDRGRRGGRHPRHDSQAPGGLHREGRQAEGAGPVGDDLPDRGHRDRGASSSASFCGRSSRPSPACSPASAPNCRCRRASSSRSATTSSASCRSSLSLVVGGSYATQALLRHRAGPPRHRRRCC